MNAFDSIIACGDSYTEGHRKALGIDISETWPAKIAKHFNVPYENLATGGASNLEIALQPLVSQKTQYEKPLYIFNFTIDERLLILSNEASAPFDSLFSLLEEDTQHISFSKEYRNIINYLLVKYKPNSEIDGFQTHTARAIELAHNVRKINPNASVLWGFIHSDKHEGKHQIFDRGGIDFDNNVKMAFPCMETCYNSSVDFRPLQYFINEPELMISQQDTHPNRDGIKILADLMIGVLQDGI
jgi:hypothetical protein